MDIVDAQFHIGPGQIDETLAAMDALGICSVLLDEFWIKIKLGDPGYPLENGAFRPVYPTAELASLKHPDRFSYLVRIDRNDPNMNAIISIAGDSPHARALRITPGLSPEEATAFVNEDYDSICVAASDCGLPVFMFAPGQMESVARYAEKFPSLRIIVDHCGLELWKTSGEALGREGQISAFDKTLALADLPNVALKWAHASYIFQTKSFPGDLLAPILRKAIDRFGADRVMWASDASANQTGECWAELLYGIVGNTDLSQEERNAVLGNTVRTWLNWPA